MSESWRTWSCKDGLCEASESELLVEAAQRVWRGSDESITVKIKPAKKLETQMAHFGIAPLETVFITDSDIRHIKRKHAEKEQQRGQLEVVPADFGVLPTVLNDFDSCEPSRPDNLGNQRFLLSKSVDDVYYVATIQREKRKLEAKTMWKRPGASC